MKKSPFRLLPFAVIAVVAGCASPPSPAATLPSSGTPVRSPWQSTKSARASALTTTPEGPCISPDAPRQEAVVKHVTDGDSIDVEVNGVPFKVRYIGIDAPEMEKEAMADESRTANRLLVEGKTIEMTRDQSEADTYGRLLRYVFADGAFVNLEMVRSGMARAGYYPPDTACTKQLKAAEKEARKALLGIWGVLGSPTYQTRVGGVCPDGCLTPPAGCRIKGNISPAGEKIYHVPGQKYYGQTVIDPAFGERWFCSEPEAVAAGWRKSKE